ncbi:hypothetical protein K1719_014240 [Acacia pycnantha]|nr:hypothetical protein K1719_014240 [Acacia pycnantha]
MSCRSILVFVFVLFVAFLGTSIAVDGDFREYFDILFGDNRARIEDEGKSLFLTLDQYSGSGIVSKSEYLFGRFDMQIKLVPGNSAGTVTAFYLSSEGPHHDEIDIEFLGNLSGDPYLMSTNIFAYGEGGREMQFYPWFDPTEDFHTYSIDWNSQRIIILVDNIPIRVMRNRHEIGVQFPTRQPMRVYTTLWNGDSWATRWGQVKIDLSNAPFIASFRNFTARACAVSPEPSCRGFSVAKKTKDIDLESKIKMQEIQEKWVVYDYCHDLRRYAHGLPFECRKGNLISE